jgi:hypothetical protein
MKLTVTHIALAVVLLASASVGTVSAKLAAHVTQPHLPYAVCLKGYPGEIILGDAGTGSIYIDATPKVL